MNLSEIFYKNTKIERKVVYQQNSMVEELYTDDEILYCVTYYSNDKKVMSEYYRPNKTLQVTLHFDPYGEVLLKEEPN